MLASAILRGLLHYGGTLDACSKIQAKMRRAALSLWRSRKGAAIAPGPLGFSEPQLRRVAQDMHTICSLYKARARKTAVIPGCLRSFWVAKTEKSTSLDGDRPSKFCLRSSLFTTENWLSAWLSPPTTVTAVAVITAQLRQAYSDTTVQLPAPHKLRETLGEKMEKSSI